jgi:hypothetical protein
VTPSADASEVINIVFCSSVVVMMDFVALGAAAHGAVSPAVFGVVTCVVTHSKRLLQQLLQRVIVWPGLNPASANIPPLVLRKDSRNSPMNGGLSLLWVWHPSQV